MSPVNNRIKVPVARKTLCEWTSWLSELNFRGSRICKKDTYLIYEKLYSLKEIGEKETESFQNISIFNKFVERHIKIIFKMIIIQT